LKRSKHVGETSGILWGNFVVAAKAIIRIDGVVVIEWPDRCNYWLDPRVDDFLEKYQFGQKVFHGCAYGLVTRYNVPLHKPMKKPWKCSSDNPKMLTYLNKRCAVNHTHVECGDEDCEASEDYTPEIIDAIRMGFGLCCGPSSQRLIALPDSRNGSFAMDHVMSCVDNDIGHVVTSIGCPQCASHLLTFPRACEIP
jgi:hypothetical protein